METPFFGGTYQSLSPNMALDRCMNLIPEVMETHQGKQIGGFYSTPGQRFLVTIGSGPVRGQRTMTTTRKLIVVVGNTVYTYDQNGVIATIGTLNTATGPVSIIDNGTQFMVVDGYQGWVFSAGAWILTPLINPVVATIQDGLGLVNQLGTDQFFQSNLNDLTIWNALNFSSADSEPSPIIGMTSLFRQIWIFKQNSTEIWNNAGLNGFAFQRMHGAYLQQGCIAPFSVSVSGDHVIWLGRDKEGGICVFMNAGYQEQRISTHPIEYAMLGYLNASQIGVSDAIGFSYMQAGHRFYVLTFPSGDATWVYDQTNGIWHERGEYINGVYHRWDPSAYAFFNNQHVVGSSSGNQLSTLDINYGTDDLPGSAALTSPKRWMRRWRAFSKPVNAPVRFGSLKLDMTKTTEQNLLLLSGHLPSGQHGQVVNYAYAVTGGKAPYTVSLLSGTLPAGLILSASGVVTGTRTTLGVYAWVVTATDALGNTCILADNCQTTDVIIYTSSSATVSAYAIKNATGSLVATIGLGGIQGGSAINPDGTRVYITLPNAAAVKVIDTSTNTVIATITVGTNPVDICVSKDGTRGYTANQTSNTVSVIDLINNVLITTVAKGSAPVACNTNPVNGDIYIVSGNNSTVYALNSDGSTKNSVAFTNPLGVNASPDGLYFFVVGTDGLTAFNATTFASAGNINLRGGNGPKAVVITPDGNTAYVADYLYTDLKVVNVSNKSAMAVITSIPAVNISTRIAIDRYGSTVFVSTTAGVVVITTAFNTISTTYPYGNFGIAVMGTNVP